MQAVIPVILSGGSGTRLWPLSRELQPKQFLPLVTERTMLQETALRTLRLGNLAGAPIVVCNEAHRFLVAEQMHAVDAAPQTIVLEPEGRNTAPAVGVAARLALEAQPDDPLLLVLPADHVVMNPDAFVAAVRIAVDVAAKGYLVTFGVVPDRPETGYGYVLKGEAGNANGEWFLLERFIEKPSRPTAEEYLRSGRYLWNSGMFVFSARRYLEELARHAPEIASACARAAQEITADPDFARLGAAFLRSPADSIDYAVMEKTRDAAVVPLAAGWSDVGSWQALHEILEKDERGNVLRGDVIVENCRNCFVSSSGRLVAVIGADGIVVVETEDAVLVVPRGAAQDVKRVVDVLKSDAWQRTRAGSEGGRG